MKKKRYAAEDWLDLGLAELSRAGPEAIKLEAICQTAGLTRGSFYHHFEDHRAFVVALTQRWLVKQTDEIAAVVAEDPAQRDANKKLDQAVSTIDYRLELSMREMARRVPEVDAIVAEADERRINLLAKIYSARFDIDQDQATELAFLEYAAFSGMILLKPEIEAVEQAKLVSLYDKLMRGALAP